MSPHTIIRALYLNYKRHIKTKLLIPLLVVCMYHYILKFINMYLYGSQTTYTIIAVSCADCDQELEEWGGQEVTGSNVWWYILCWYIATATERWWQYYPLWPAAEKVSLAYQPISLIVIILLHMTRCNSPFWWTNIDIL